MSDARTAEDVPVPRVKTAAGGYAMTDEEYNRKWMERLQARTIIDASGCYLWQGPRSSKGYIMLTHRKWPGQGHRNVYRIKCDPNLKTEEFVCHTCDVRHCWNEAHLFVGSAKVNNRDCGNKGRHHNSIKTTCSRGHEYTFENTYLKVTPTTVMRSCLECEKIRRNWPHYKEKARERLRRRRAKRRAEILGVEAI